MQVNGKHPSDFKVTQQPKARISPKAKSRFKVRFAPRRSGDRRAQLRVVSNDANENPFRIDVSGSKKVTPPPPTSNWTGDWDTYAGFDSTGKMLLFQDGTTVTGYYTKGKGRITATVQGSQLVGRWSEPPTHLPPHDAGDVEFHLSEDGNTFGGRWSYGSSALGWEASWPGTKLE